MAKIKQVIHQYYSHDGSLFRYALSYCLLLSLLPALTIILFFYKEINLDHIIIMERLYEFIPQELLKPFVEYVLNKDYASFRSFVMSLIVATYVSSRTVYSFMLLSMQNEEFDMYRLPVRVKAFFVTFLLIVAVCGISLISQYLIFLSSYIFFIGLFVVHYLFYRTLSFEKKPWDYGVIGGLVSSLLIVLIGNLFFWFIKYFTSYDHLYGPFASLVILFLAIYLVSSLIYLGYCLNEVYGRRFDDKEYKHICYYRCFTQFIDWIDSHFLK